MFCPFCGQENENTSTFCMYCGKSMQVQPENSPPEIQQNYPPVAPLPPAPQSNQKFQGFLPYLFSISRKRPILIAAGVLILILVVAFLIVPNVANVGAGGGDLTYVVQENSVSGPFEAIGRMKAGSNNVVELASDPEGYYPSNIYFTGISRKILSPTGKNFVLRERSFTGDLMLFSDDGNIPVFLGYQDQIGISEGFSPDSKYFAFSFFDENREELGTHVYDTQGTQILNFEFAIFGSFLPDGNKMIVYETEYIDELIIKNISVVDVLTGEITIATNEELNISDLTSLPFSSGDGQEIYFSSAGQLLSVPISGGTAKTVYEFDSDYSKAFLAPDKKNLVILDTLIDTNTTDLLMYDPQTNRRIRIDKEIALPNDGQSLYGDAPIKFSTDGRYAAYMINKEGRFELFVTNIETRQRTSMVSGSNWVTFAFSPDNKRIAYIDGRSTTGGGSLFVRDIDGGNRTRLDTDVWSFKFDSRGRNLYYFKVDDMSSRRPETEMFRIQVDAKNKELVLPAEDGILTFLVD